MIVPLASCASSVSPSLTRVASVSTRPLVSQRSHSRARGWRAGSRPADCRQQRPASCCRADSSRRCIGALQALLLTAACPPADGQCERPDSPAAAVDCRPACRSRSICCNRRLHDAAQPRREFIGALLHTLQHGARVHAGAAAGGERCCHAAPAAAAGSVIAQAAGVAPAATLIRVAESGTSTSAAPDGVGARTIRHEVRNREIDFVAHRSETTGNSLANIARATISSLKHHRSSSEPPPRPTISASSQRARWQSRWRGRSPPGLLRPARGWGRARPPPAACAASECAGCRASPRRWAR